VQAHVQACTHMHIVTRTRHACTCNGMCAYIHTDTQMHTVHAHHALVCMDVHSMLVLLNGHARKYNYNFFKLNLGKLHLYAIMIESNNIMWLVEDNNSNPCFSETDL